MLIFLLLLILLLQQPPPLHRFLLQLNRLEVPLGSLLPLLEPQSRDLLVLMTQMTAGMLRFFWRRILSDSNTFLESKQQEQMKIATEFERRWKTQQGMLVSTHVKLLTMLSAFDSLQRYRDKPLLYLKLHERGLRQLTRCFKDLQLTARRHSMVSIKQAPQAVPFRLDRHLDLDMLVQPRRVVPRLVHQAVPFRLDRHLDLDMLVQPRRVVSRLVHQAVPFRLDRHLDLLVQPRRVVPRLVQKMVLSCFNHRNSDAEYLHPLVGLASKPKLQIKVWWISKTHSKNRTFEASPSLWLVQCPRHLEEVPGLVPPVALFFYSLVHPVLLYSLARLQLLPLSPDNLLLHLQHPEFQRPRHHQHRRRV
jgi:hypothetical protein